MLGNPGCIDGRQSGPSMPSPATTAIDALRGTRTAPPVLQDADRCTTAEPQPVDSTSRTPKLRAHIVSMNP